MAASEAYCVMTDLPWQRFRFLACRKVAIITVTKVWKTVPGSVLCEQEKHVS